MQSRFFNIIANNTNPKSFSHHLRIKRFQIFLSFLDKLPKPISILDIGGTAAFWKAMQFNEPGVSITLLNLELTASDTNPFILLQGDATNLCNIQDKQYDLVFSNSVIEHLFTWQNQQKMAAEVHRVAKWHFIQTPNYWFPIEPHWLFPGFHFFPRKLRIWLTQHFSLGHIPKQQAYASAERQVDEIKLLTKQEMKILFPFSSIYCEKFLGFHKSFIFYSIDNQSK